MTHRSYLTWSLASTAILVVSLLIAMCSGGKREEKSMSNIKNLMPAGVAGWQRVGEPATYDRETIFDYIDGAGEVYLQFGFRECAAADFAAPDQPKLTVEIFDMGSSEDAYGLMSHIREEPEAGVGQGSQQAGSILYFWQDRFFASICPERRTEAAENEMRRIADQIISTIGTTGAKPDILKYLPQSGLRTRTIRYFHLHPSLNYHYYLSPDNILELNDTTEGLLAEYDPDGALLLLLRYPTQEAAESALKSFISGYIPEFDESGPVELEDGDWVTARRSGRFLTIALDAPSRERAEQIVADASKNLRD
jgi:hypothetical protein